jgi:MYXO-CTERM domain-containing protein
VGLTFVRLLTPNLPVAGTAVALDGMTAVAGAPQIGTGEAFVFTFGSPTGSACTSPGACFSGYCVDGVCCDTSACAAAGPCNAAETCQASTGICSVTPINEGMACDVDDACNSSATCKAGVCTGEITVCAPADACHDFGACDPTVGMCTNPVKPDGQPCPGGTCAGGVCVVTPGEDGGQSDAGGPAGSAAAGCQCDVSRSPSSGTLAVALGLLLLGWRRPRHRREKIHADVARKHRCKTPLGA